MLLSLTFSWPLSHSPNIESYTLYVFQYYHLVDSIRVESSVSWPNSIPKLLVSLLNGGSPLNINITLMFVFLFGPQFHATNELFRGEWFQAISEQVLKLWVCLQVWQNMKFWDGSCVSVSLMSDGSQSSLWSWESDRWNDINKEREQKRQKTTLSCQWWQYYLHNWSDHRKTSLFSIIIIYFRKQKSYLVSHFLFTYQT